MINQSIYLQTPAIGQSHKKHAKRFLEWNKSIQEVGYLRWPLTLEAQGLFDFYRNKFLCSLILTPLNWPTQWSVGDQFRQVNYPVAKTWSFCLRMCYPKMCPKFHSQFDWIKFHTQKWEDCKLNELGNRLSFTSKEMKEINCCFLIQGICTIAWML